MDDDVDIAELHDPDDPDEMELSVRFWDWVETIADSSTTIDDCSRSPVYHALSDAAQRSCDFSMALGEGFLGSANRACTIRAVRDAAARLDSHQSMRVSFTAGRLDRIVFNHVDAVFWGLRELLVSLCELEPSDGQSVRSLTVMDAAIRRIYGYLRVGDLADSFGQARLL